MVKMKKKIAVMLLLLTFFWIFPFSTVQAAGAEGYNLRGWDKQQEKWSPGNLSGYTELDWVPFGLEMKNYQGNATEICFQHDYQKGGKFAYSEARNFYIGDSDGNILYSLGDGIFSVSGPEIREENGGVEIMEYCFHIQNAQALIDLGEDFFLYWETQLAGPNQASSWSGSSLHTTTSVTGAQTVPISTQKIAPYLAAQLELKKTASTSLINPGDTMTYTFKVTNIGDYDLTNVTVTDVLFGTNWSHAVGTLLVGQSVSFDVSYTVPANAQSGPFVNTATATGEYTGGSVSATDDETVTVQTVTANDPSIDIHKNASVTKAKPGDEITYSIHVTNTGNVDLENVIVSDPLFGAAWSYSIALLHVGEIKTFEVPYTIPSNFTGTILENTATVKGVYAGGEVSANAKMSVMIEQTNPPDPYASIELIKTVSSETVNPGGTITYHFTVVNMGTYPLTNVMVVDPLFGEAWSYSVGNLQPGASVSFDKDYTVAQNSPSGVIENIAAVSALYSEGTITDSASETVSVVALPPNGQPSLQVDKTSDVQNVNPGNTISYTIKVTNNGNVALTDVTATDFIMGNSWFYNFGNLSVGESKQYTYSYLLPLGTLAGNLTNTANVTANYSGGTVTASDSQTIIIDAPPPTIVNLILNSVCSQDPTITRVWRITNTNHIDIPISWQLLESEESGTAVISGDSDFFLETQAVVGNNTLKISYLNGREDEKLSSGEKCSSNSMKLITIHSMCVANQESNLVEWQVNNPNSYSVDATWVLENQSGVITIKPGISVFYTNKIPNNPNSLTLYINGKIYAVESRACYQDIILTAECSEDPEQSLRWKLTNNNFYPVEVTWVLLNSDPSQTGKVIAQPGENYFYTNPISGDNIVAIFVDKVLQQNGTVKSEKVKCSDNNEEETGTIVEIGDMIIPSIPGGTVLIDDIKTAAVPSAGKLPATGGGSVWFFYLTGAILILSGGLLFGKKFFKLTKSK